MEADLRADGRAARSPRYFAPLGRTNSKIKPERKKNMAKNKNVPDWVSNTPPDHSYSLSMYENSDAAIEEIELTRAEYIMLKTHIATMRGYCVSKEAATGADIKIERATEAELRQLLSESLESMDR